MTHEEQHEISVVSYTTLHGKDQWIPFRQLLNIDRHVIYNPSELTTEKNSNVKSLLSATLHTTRN